MQPTPDDPVTLAMTAMPRTGFLPREERGRAAYDGPIPIGQGQTNSQPRTVEDMLRLLDADFGHRVLDVGAGSGWTTALLAQIVGPAGLVIGVERVPELQEFATENLRACRIPWAKVFPARSEVLGWPGAAPYDRILVSAQAPQLPPDLVAQLRPGGVLVMPVDGRMLRYAAGREPGEAPEVTRHGFYRFVPLIE